MNLEVYLKSARLDLSNEVSSDNICLVDFAGEWSEVKGY